MRRFSLIFGLFALLLGTASCDITFSKKNEVPPADSDSIVLNTDKEWTKSDLTAFIGDLSALPQELQTEIAQRFPKKAGLEAATVIFAGASDVAAQAARLAQAASGGAFVVVPAGVAERSWVPGYTGTSRSTRAGTMMRRPSASPRSTERK